ncbi:protein SON isoform X2 [Cynoglossus semilaevis]|uniref:protein SON isoform X2 n=1 Tax=Cynoglossus semilaevis TaxID=244447 RepID=UPI000D626C0A|nr:protein SON isoform X2 [Cynoglossus semilaevis]
MAANIEQIFQDFILNKIREIEDQGGDNAAYEGVDAAEKDREVTEKSSTVREKHGETKDCVLEKKPKKHKKHKSKKKKKKREHEKGNSSEPETELEESKHQSRKAAPTESNANDEEKKKKSDTHKRHSTGKKKKKKKRRRKHDDNSSDSDSEYLSKIDRKSGTREELELPDIIPKQDSSNQVRRDESKRDGSCSHSRSHSNKCSHSCTVTRTSRSRSRHRYRRSRSRSLSSLHQHRARSRSAEKKTTLQESSEEPSEDLHPPSLVFSGSQTTNISEKLTQSAEPQRPEQSEKPAEKKEDATQQFVRDWSLSKSGLNQSKSTEPERTTEPGRSQRRESNNPGTDRKSSEKKRRKGSRSPHKSEEGKTSKRRKTSRSPHRSCRRGSRSDSRSRRTRSRSRSGSHSWSALGSRRRTTYNQRDRWKRNPSHSPVLILRKDRSPGRKHSSSSSSPHRITDLDKEQLLEIAKANAAAMCAKAGMPIPAGLRSSVLPLALPSMAVNAAVASMTAATMTAALSNIGSLSSLLSLPTITSKPPAAASQATVAALDEAKKKVEKQANSISIKEFTDKCKMIVDSKGELPVAMPHVSDEEDDGKPFGVATLREQKVISFNISNTTVRPGVRSDAGIAKEFPVSSGSQHRKKEGETLGAYGEWVPVDKTTDKASGGSKKPQGHTFVALAAALSSSGETAAAAAAEESPDVVEPRPVPVSDSVFPDPVLQPVDISQAVTERIKAQRRLAENPYDVSAICMLNRAQEQLDAWAQSSTVPGLFTGSTGAQVLSSEELSNSGPQAWLKKDQFLRAAPVSGGVGEFLMRKMGWRTGEGLGRNREGTVEPIIIDFKVDRKGLVAEGEKPQKQTGGLVVTKDLMGKHPVSALIELCNKRRIMQPEFVMVHHSGPDHRKNFLFKVTLNGVDYQPQTPSPNKKHAKAMAATVALQALGEISPLLADSFLVGL